MIPRFTVHVQAYSTESGVAGPVVASDMDNKVYSSHCAEGKLQSLREQQERAELPFETGNALGTPPDCDTCRGLEEQGMTSGVSYPFPLVFWRDSTLDEKRRYMEEFSEPFIQKLSWLRWVSTSASSSV